MLQKTIQKEVECSGIGIHTGLKAKLVFSPAAENAGIYFVREDLPNHPRIKAELKLVSSTVRGTNLSLDKIHISTVEHVLAACWGLGISNLQITLFSSEPPILDGGAAEFVKLLKSAGLVEQSEKQKVKQLKDTIAQEEGESLLLAIPAEKFKITCIVDYPDTFIGAQISKYDGGFDEFESEIAPARTYGFLSEVAALKERGLALGGSLENAVVIDKDKYLTPLKFRNELARHKVLDLLGDLSLLGCRINANIISIKGGHKHNIELARRLACQK